MNAFCASEKLLAFIRFRFVGQTVPRTVCLPSSVSQPEKRSGKLQLQTAQFPGIRSTVAADRVGDADCIFLTGLYLAELGISEHVMRIRAGARPPRKRSFDSRARTRCTAEAKSPLQRFTSYCEPMIGCRASNLGFEDPGWTGTGTMRGCWRVWRWGGVVWGGWIGRWATTVVRQQLIGAGGAPPAARRALLGHAGSVQRGACGVRAGR
jgi:hypothetical protein